MPAAWIFALSVRCGLRAPDAFQRMLVAVTRRRVLSGGECVELESAQGLGEAGVASGAAFGWFLGLGFGDDVEAFALATVQIVGTGGDVKRLAIRVQRDDADVVPPLLPVDSVEAAQRGLVLSPGRFPFADVDDPADRAAVLGDEVDAELFQPFHCAGFGLHGEACGDVSDSLLTGEKVGLPCHGGQYGVVLQMLGVVPCGGEAEFADFDRDGGATPLVKAPVAEGQAPVFPLDHDAAGPGLGLLQAAAGGEGSESRGEVVFGQAEIQDALPF